MGQLSYHYSAQYIGGEWKQSASDERLDVVNPATEEVIGAVPAGSERDMALAVAAARRAFDEGPWPRMKGKERSRHLARLADVLAAHHDEIMALIVAESGTPAGTAEAVHWAGGMAHLSFCADLAAQDLSQTMPLSFAPRPGRAPMLGTEVVLRRPIGVVGAITPYNFPFYLNICKIAPALATGNTMVLKPSPLTPLEAGSIITRDTGAAYQMAARMDTGRVRINGGNGVMSVHSPMGGWKRSGLGTEHGLDGALEFTLAQTISFNAG
jgi:aldehyde dehydrogenase (NAD+)